jgi:methylthioribose-1-phosphate isomerase
MRTSFPAPGAAAAPAHLLLFFPSRGTCFFVRRRLSWEKQSLIPNDLLIIYNLLSNDHARAGRQERSSPMEAIRFAGNTLYLLDQTSLPSRELWREYDSPEGVAEAIRTMVVRGAPAIGIAAAYGYALAARFAPEQTPAELKERMQRAKDVLAASRPTAVNLFWALKRMETVFSSLSGQECSTIYPALCAEASSIHREDVEMNRNIGRFGAELVPRNARILTHCNAGALATGGYGTALGVVRAAFEQKKISMVYCDETRPLLQGARLTAFELHKDGIPATLIADSMAGSLMAAGRIDLVLVGCDRMAGNGDFANKIGTYPLAVLARHHKIPFYPVLPGSTIDLSLPDGSGIPIEQRAREELTHLGGIQLAPENVEVYNPAFDVTPHSFVTGIITDRGVLYPPFGDTLAELFQ